MEKDKWWKNSPHNQIYLAIKFVKYCWEEGKRKIENSQCLNQHQVHLGRSTSYWSLLENSLKKSPKGQKEKGILEQQSEIREAKKKTSGT